MAAAKSRTTTSAASLALPYGLMGIVGVASVMGSTSGLPYVAHVLRGEGNTPGNKSTRVLMGGCRACFNGRRYNGCLCLLTR